MASESLVSLAELKKLRPPLLNTHEEHRKRLSQLDQLALWIARHVGTMGFFIIIFIWTISWLTWNAFGPVEQRFDPAPAFVLWLFISNMIQIFLMPLLMIGQNLESRHSEIRADHEYEVSRKAEREVEVILTHLEFQSQLLDKIYEQTKKTR